MLILAPMYDVTDVVFRRIVASLGPPDLALTEFVNVEGLVSRGRERLLPYLYRAPDEAPLIAQIWGDNPENYYAVAKDLAKQGFVGIDINMGCPDRRINKNGGCCALILPQHRKRVQEIIAATISGAGSLPVSVKTRLGYESINREWPIWLLDQGIAMLTIHARTKKEMSKVPAHWDDLIPIVEYRNSKSLPVKLIGNGDVVSQDQAQAWQKKYGLDGVMIGRGALNNPAIFAPNPDLWQNKTPKEKAELYARHLKLHSETYPEGQRHWLPLKKFMKVYLTGFREASLWREKIANCSSLTDMRHTLDQALAVL